MLVLTGDTVLPGVVVVRSHLSVLVLAYDGGRSSGHPSYQLQMQAACLHVKCKRRWIV